MRNETIIVVKDTESPIGTYVEDVKGVYSVPVKDFNIKNEYSAYVTKLYASNGFKCEIDEFDNVRLLWKKGEKYKRRKELKKMEKMLSTELTLIYYLEQVLKAEKISYIEFYI